MELLKALSEAPGVSGNERAVRKIVREAIADHVDEMRVDHLGNLIAMKRSRSGSVLKVMLAAHMDEVGLMIVRIGSDGLLKFRTVGGIDPRILLAKAVYVGDNKVPGIIGVKPVHLQKREERERVLQVEDLTIDIGATNENQAKEAVKPGDYVTFATAFGEVGNLWKGKAFDDRAGCAVLIELLKEEYPFELYGVFTVQEELGLRGARVAAYDINPDVAFALEGTIADDLPKDKDTSPTTEIGKGPAITLMDRSFIADRRLVKLLVETAEAHDIPYQFKQPGIGGTDAGSIHLAREGVPSATVAVPCRYIHSPAALMSPQDFQHTVTLMTQALQRLPEVL